MSKKKDEKSTDISIIECAEGKSPTVIDENVGRSKKLAASLEHIYSLDLNHNPGLKRLLNDPVYMMCENIPDAIALKLLVIAFGGRDDLALKAINTMESIKEAKNKDGKKKLNINIFNQGKVDEEELSKMNDAQLKDLLNSPEALL